PFGKARQVREGGDVTLIAWSAAVEMCQQAADELQREGISAGVLDLRTLGALDVEGLGSGVSRTRRAVVVHEGPRSAAVWAEGGGASLWGEAGRGRARGGAPPYPPASLEGWYLPTIRRVVEAARKTAAA